MKKVALLISSFRPGGGERQMLEIAAGLAARGHRVDLLVLNPTGALAGRVSAAVRVVSLYRGRMARSLPPLVAYLRRERPQAIMANDEYGHLLALAAVPLARTRTRVVLRVGSRLSELFAHRRGLRHWLNLRLIKRFYRRADAIIANAKGVADDTLALTGADPSRVKVIYNPKPIADLRRQAAEATGEAWLDHKEAPALIAVGRLVPQKNFSLLIRAFSRLTGKTDARLVIIGGGKEEGRLRALAAELGCGERVRLAGHVDNPAAWLARADVFVATSLWEGLPNALIEALIFGLPVVATDCDAGPREILAPESDYRFRLPHGAEYTPYGILVSTQDESALTEALERLLDEPALRKHYARAAAERSEAFSMEKLLRAYEQALGL